MYYISIESHGGNQLNRSTKESNMFSTFETQTPSNPSLSYNEDHAKSMAWAREKSGYDSELYRAYYIIAMFIRGQYHYGNLKLSNSEERRLKRYMRREEDVNLLIEYLVPHSKLYPC